jgi:hypothetical protein
LERPLAPDRVNEPAIVLEYTVIGVEDREYATLLMVREGYAGGIVLTRILNGYVDTFVAESRSVTRDGTLPDRLLYGMVVPDTPTNVPDGF